MWENGVADPSREQLARALVPVTENSTWTRSPRQTVQVAPRFQTLGRDKKRGRHCQPSIPDVG